ncbi:MAG: hypothetical protein Q8K48_07570 [Candidatus Planktophila sp.]|nr:hypothetical protein [Candidatus Planktophila sp.]
MGKALNGNAKRAIHGALLLRTAQRARVAHPVLYAWKRSILKALKDSGAELDNTLITGKLDGYSEAWVQSPYPVKKLKDLMELVRASEE